jgi:hypothetical protein
MAATISGAVTGVSSLAATATHTNLSSNGGSIAASSHLAASASLVASVRGGTGAISALSATAQTSIPTTILSRVAVTVTPVARVAVDTSTPVVASVVLSTPVAVTLTETPL